MSEKVPLRHFPLRYNVWIFLAYLGAVIWVGILAAGFRGVLATLLVAALSFQFWVYAAWRGVTAKDQS